MNILTLFIMMLLDSLLAQQVTEERSSLCPLGPSCTVRTYYIATEEVDWDYAPSGYDHVSGKPLKDTDAFIWTVRYPNRIGAIYRKAIYQEYTDATFNKTKNREEHLGILGPIIRAEVGDIIKVVYKNFASIPYGVHAHGVLYSKENEGSTYHNLEDSVDGTAVPTNEIFTYTWIVGERASPGPADGNSKLWAYHSHNTDPGDIYTGMFGALIVYKQGVLDKTTGLPNDVDREFILNFLVFNENLSHYLRDSIVKFAPELKDRLLKNQETSFEIGGDMWIESNLMHSINGRMFGNLDGLEMKVGETVRWHLMGFGTEVDIHTAHWHSQTVLMDGHRVDVVELFPATFRSVIGKVDAVGTWLLHCHVMDHQVAGMDVLYHVTDNNTNTIKSLVDVQASKTAMDAPPAPRPPLAAPLLGLNGALSLEVGIINSLITILSLFLIFE